MTTGILSERRALRPFGLLGGCPAAAGLNLWLQATSGKAISLGGKATACVGAGDRLRILTPGGGGFGPVEEERATGQAAGSASSSGAGDGAVLAAAAARAAEWRRSRGGEEAEAPGAAHGSGSVHEYRRRQETA